MIHSFNQLTQNRTADFFWIYSYLQQIVIPGNLSSYFGLIYKRMNHSDGQLSEQNVLHNTYLNRY